MVVVVVAVVVVAVVAVVVWEGESNPLVPSVDACVLYISTNVWVLRTPNAGRNGHFQHFLCKKP